MKKLSVFLFLIPLLLASLACGAGELFGIPTATPTPISALEQGLTMVSDKINAEATQQKFNSIVEITRQVDALTATQQAAYAQATQAQQVRIDAQATANKADAIAQATADQARRDAAATQQRIDAESTQQAIHIQATQQRLDFEATQSQARLDLSATQAAEGTARAWSVTQAVIPTHDLWTQQAVQQNVLIATNEVELSNLKVKQQQDTNVLQWLVPMLLAIFLAVVVANYLHSHSRVREVKDADGNTQVLVLDNAKVIKPALLPKPMLLLETGEMPDVTDPDQQFQIVRGNQAVEALSVMPSSPAESAVDVYNNVFSSSANEEKLPAIEWVQPSQIGPGILEDIEGQVMEE